MKITQIKRNSKYHNSVDKFLNTLNPHIKKKVDLKELICPYPNNGFINKLKNLYWATLIKDKNIHITGDVTYLSLAFLKKNLIITILDMGMSQKSNSLRKKIFNFFWFRLPIAFSKKVIAISEKTKKEIIEYYPNSKSKIEVVHVPLTEGYNFKNINDNKTFKVLQIATSSHNKNVTRSIKSLKDLKIEYNFVGIINDKQKQILKDLKIKNSLFYNISESKLIQLYNDCDILLFPSIYEGFGMPIVEAQATSCCVVTSNIEPLMEVGGNGALYVDPFNIDQISTAISSIINNKDLFLQQIKNGLVNVSRFSPKKISNNYINIYQCLEEF
jgi:glycosyltransferase involved in cell wall biosynthesis